tara:strand:+ start:578 stop:1744 length:1167 start_codon:yes stop_codon:yes gene_type:complete
MVVKSKKNKVKRTKRVKRVKRVKRTKRTKRTKRVKRTRRSFLKNKRRKTQKRKRVLRGGMVPKKQIINSKIDKLRGEIRDLESEIRVLAPAARNPVGSDGSDQTGTQEYYDIQDKQEIITKKKEELEREFEKLRKEEERIKRMEDLKREPEGLYANIPISLNVSIRTVRRVTLKVSTLNRGLETVSVPVNGTVKDIKEEIFKLRGIPVNAQRLTKEGVELVNTLTIEGNINLDSNLYLTFKEPTVEVEDQDVPSCGLSDLEPEIKQELTVEDILPRITVEEFKNEILKKEILTDLYPTPPPLSRRYRDHNSQLFKRIESDRSLTRLEKDMKYGEEVLVFSPEIIELYYLQEDSQEDSMVPFENHETLFSYGINFVTEDDFEIIAVLKI